MDLSEVKKFEEQSGETAEQKEKAERMALRYQFADLLRKAEELGIRQIHGREFMITPTGDDPCPCDDMVITGACAIGAVYMLTHHWEMNKTPWRVVKTAGMTPAEDWVKRTYGLPLGKAVVRMNDREQYSFGEIARRLSTGDYYHTF